MKLQLIRSATLVLEVAGRRLLIDPDLPPRHARPSFTGRSPNPLVELPFSAGEILTNVELILVSPPTYTATTLVTSNPYPSPFLCSVNQEMNARSLLKGLLRSSPSNVASLGARFGLRARRAITG